MQNEERVTISQAAKAIGRTRQQLERESKRLGFPLHRGGDGKPYVILAEVVKWRDGEIRLRKPGSLIVAGDTKVVQFVDWVMSLVTLDDVTSADADNPLGAVSWLGPELFSQQTIDDLKSLAGFYNFAIATRLVELVRGEGQRDVPKEAPESTYQALYDRADDKRLQELFHFAPANWCACRFVKEPKWWRKLPNKPKECPVDMRDAEPLPHRRRA